MNDYIKENYERLAILLPKGGKKVLADMARDCMRKMRFRGRDLSITQYLYLLVEADMNNYVRWDYAERVRGFEDCTKFRNFAKHKFEAELREHENDE